MSESPFEPATIQYASTMTRPAPPMLAATSVLLAGLSLVAFGGGCLYGIHSAIYPVESPFAPQRYGMARHEEAFALFLAACACASFVGAAMMLWSGARALLRIADGGLR